MQHDRETDGQQRSAPLRESGIGRPQVFRDSWHRDRSSFTGTTITREFGETIESLLRRAKKATSQTGVLAEARRHEHHEKPSVRRRRKSAAARRRIAA